MTTCTRTRASPYTQTCAPFRSYRRRIRKQPSSCCSRKAPARPSGRRASRMHFCSRISWSRWSPCPKRLRPSRCHGLVGAPTMRKLFELSDRLGARVILQGDSRQHPSVERGDALRYIEEHGGLKFAQLKEIRRQEPPGHKSTDESFQNGDVAEGFGKLRELGWVHEIKDGSRKGNRDRSRAPKGKAEARHPAGVEDGRARRSRRAARTSRKRGDRSGSQSATKRKGLASGFARGSRTVGSHDAHRLLTRCPGPEGLQPTSCARLGSTTTSMRCPSSAPRGRRRVPEPLQPRRPGRVSWAAWGGGAFHAGNSNPYGWALGPLRHAFGGAGLRPSGTQGPRAPATEERGPTACVDTRHARRRLRPRGQTPRALPGK